MPSSDISIIGYAVRLPQAADVSQFWSVLDEGRCVVTEVSEERWPRARYGHPRAGTKGRSITWSAGQIDDPWDFDPAFFGISPREAVQIDPQQRLLLQVTWEALEQGAIRPSDLAGSRTGVYVGASALDYSQRFLLDPAAADLQFMTGNTLSIISNRISYIYDLRGPSFTVDTACSSSLVALHEASEALRAGRIDTAIVAGVNMLMSPFAFMGFSAASMLSPAGQCRAFDAAGDGYVRSEGATVIVLRTAQAAQSAGNRSFAKLVATGLNSDGRTVGMSLPSSESQGDLLETIYREHELDPRDLAFIEAHGTGTRVGDPAEAFALGNKLGKRREEPLLIGSVKTNIGHLEPASGLAGLIKSMMALEHDRFPASLHFETPNPDIPFADLNLAVASEAVALERTGNLRLAGINSFGFGGTNAHVVIADPDPVTESAPPQDGPLILSARSEAALKALAARYGDHLAASRPEERARIAASAAYARDPLEHRLVVLEEDPQARIAALQAFAADKPVPGARNALVSGSGLAGAEPVVFAYTGNGSQWAGMGTAAYRDNAVFREAFDRLDRKFMSLSGWSLVSMLYSADLESEIERTEIAQPLLLAVQIALTEALAAKGVTPDAVLGHSVGEVAAAWAAGMIDLDAAVRIIYARSTHQEMTRHLGGMAALLLPPEEARAALDAAGATDIEIAAINSPRSVTISGPGESLDAFAAHARKKRLAMRRLALDYPFHCHLVDPIHAPLMESLQGLTSTPAKCRFVSTVDPKRQDCVLDAQYWWDNVRKPVLFADALSTLIEEGYKVVLEVGPMPILGSYARDVLREAGQSATVLASLEKPKKQDQTHESENKAPKGESFATKPDPIAPIAAGVAAHGGAIDLARFVGRRPDIFSALPSYPWQNKRFYPEATEENVHIFTGRQWPLLGFRLRPGQCEWMATIDTDTHPFIGDHQIEGSILMPGTGMMEMALRAARLWFKTTDVELRDFDILRPIVLEEAHSQTLRVRISPDDKVLEIESRPRLGGADWSLNVRCTIAKAPKAGAAVRMEEGPVTGSMSGDELYKLALHYGLEYGPSFRRAAQVALHGPMEASVTLAPSLVKGLDFAVDPMLLDSGFHGLITLLHASGVMGSNVSFLPVRIGRFRLCGTNQPARARIKVSKANARSVEAAFEFLDAEGALVARLTHCRFRSVALGHADQPDDLIYRTIATPLPLVGAASAAASLSETESRLIDVPADGAREPEEALLLVEALARAISLETLQGFADQEGILSLKSLEAEGKVAQNAIVLCRRLLDNLEAGGLAERLAAPDRWALLLTEETPSAADLLRTLALEAPERIAEIALLSRLDTDLARHLKNGLPESAAEAFAAPLLQHFLTGSPTYAPLGQKLVDALTQLSAAWSKHDPLRVLLVGAVDGALVGELADVLDPSNASLTVTDADEAHLSRGQLNWSGATHVVHLPLQQILDDGEETHRFDVIIGASLLTNLAQTTFSNLGAHLAPGAVLFVTEPTPSPLLDTIFGVGADWWCDTVEPDQPVSRPRTLDEWREALEAAGFADVQGAQLIAPGTEAVALQARARMGAAKTEATTKNSEDTAADLIVLHDEAGLSHDVASALVDALKRAGRKPRLLCNGADTPREIADLGHSVEIIHLAGAFASTGDDNARVQARAQGLVELLKTAGAAIAGLWLVAPDAMQSFTGERRHDAVQAAVWAFARVAMNEFPEAGLRLLDISAVLAPGEFATRLADEILNPSDEREILRGMDSRSGLRLLHGGLLSRDTTVSHGAELAAYLDIPQQGALDGLAWRTVERRTPAAGEVEIEVKASGLNFRDVMWALGLLPEEALEDGFAGPTLGMECAGVITRVGEGVTAFAPGDAVITFAPACFASHVTVSHTAMAPMPRAVSFTEAATIPVPFLTAYYALLELARLQPGETALIHGGAGGVGLAALQLAKWRGATVISTAGTPEKRNFLRLLGADHVYDSRSLDFAEEVLDLTDGEGVDVVLNSLFGEPMERSIELLKPFGRFLELGKRDYYGNTRIGLRPFRQNLTYFGIDADQLLTRQPDLAKRLFADLVALFDEGELAPLPYRRFEAGSVVEAFRVMQQSGHIGKIVLGPPAAPDAPPARTELDFSGNKTQVIVGGFGGFGSQLLRWLATNGARHLAVIGRSGGASEAAQDVIAALEAEGVEVRAIAADATDRDAVAHALDGVRTDMPPIAGVFHTAMVLHDTLIANLDADGMARVIAPKVAAAGHLDVLTANDPVETFVMFSSATTLVGNPGQANYVAANGYLEALARKRRADGKPGLAVGWGAISDAGYLARNADVNDLVARKLGRHALTANEALAGLGRLLSLPEAQRMNPDLAAVGYARIDWAQARRDLALLNTPLVARLGLGSAGDGLEEGAIDLAAMLDGLDAAAAVKTVGRLLSVEIGRILRIAPEEIDTHKPLSDIGMDSLMALELRMACERQLGVDIPLMSLANGATLNDLSARIVKRVRGEELAISGDVESLASHHLGGDAEQLDTTDAADLAAKVEASGRNVGKLLN
ncbi:SDR family NAD(P)-dependent oxidoreductase [Breoghania sp.]|uniref:SDR family NAD(P)-dependent oxidoreductase n=1 Tax=Breoghania sp. TaxID=2065378 RepID=UPI0029C9E899|nr:SDR family NAD(P)-dependent oxidoreductase [Breoghania sp.]